MKYPACGFSNAAGMNFCASLSEKLGEEAVCRLMDRKEEIFPDREVAEYQGQEQVSKEGEKWLREEDLADSAMRKKTQ